MNPVLLVLGGGASAKAALSWAREADLHVVLIDSDPRSPLRRVAAEFHLIPTNAHEACAALARRLERQGSLAGVFATAPETLALLPILADAVPHRVAPRATLERMLDAKALRAFLRGRGLAVSADTGEPSHRLDLFAFFRDGAFVPGGIAGRRTLPNGDVSSTQPSGIDSATATAAYLLVERAARSLGYLKGPLQASLHEDEGELRLASLVPAFTDLLGATHVARLAYGKSPVQAWFAHLAGSGGPFDELVLAQRSVAGWLSLTPQKAGFFAGIDGLARARSVPGLVDLCIEEPGRELLSPELPQAPLGYLWAEGIDERELDERLQAARALLEPRVACRQTLVA